MNGLFHPQTPGELSPQNWQLLSAYLDGQLSGREKALIEQQLQREPAWREGLETLRKTRAVLRAAPRRRAPRNFTLSPALAQQPRSGWLLPFFRFSSAFATLLVLLSFALQYLPGRAVPTAVYLESDAALQNSQAVQNSGTPPPLIVWGGPQAYVPLQEGYNQPGYGGMGGGGGNDGGAAASMPPPASARQEASAAKTIAGGEAPPPVLSAPEAVSAGMQPEAASMSATGPSVTAADAAPEAMPAEQAAPTSPPAPTATPAPSATPIAVPEAEQLSDLVSGAGPILGVRPGAEAQASNSQSVQSLPTPLPIPPAAPPGRTVDWPLVRTLLLACALGSLLAVFVLQRKARR